VIAPADSFTKVALNLSNTQVEPIAACVAPVLVATQLLNSVPTKQGDVIVQNGAGSTVGQAVIQLAAAKGLRSVNIMRLATDWAGVVKHLQGIGATTVVSEAQAARHEFRKVLADFPAPVLGLNGIGGASAGQVASALGANGTLVTYGAMTNRAIVAPLSLFTGKNLTLKGFNLNSWVASTSKADRDAEVTNAVASVASGKVKLLVAREPFKDFGAALKRSYQKDQRKIVLTF
jgi:trans-2-enoyl-CoA reductase